MDAFEMAFFYGDYSALSELTRELLAENDEDTTTAE